MEAGGEPVLVQPFLRQLRQGVPQELPQGFQVFLLRIHGDPGEDRLLYSAVQLQDEVLGEAAVQHRPLQGGFVVPRQIIRQHGGGKELFRFVVSADELCGADDGALFGILLRADLIGDHPGDRRHRLLHGDGEIRFLEGKGGEEGIDLLQHRYQVHAAHQGDAGVGGMVILPVVRDELLIGQVRDAGGIPAGVEAVAVVGTEECVGLMGHDAHGGGHAALHLVEHHALVADLIAFPLVPPALLTEDLRFMVDGGVEHRVQIHVDQVEKILIVPGAHGIDGLIREGEGVQKGLHGAFQQLHEGLLYRIPVRAAEHRMLQDMEHAGGILRQGLEGDGEGLVLVRPVQPAELGPGAQMLHFHQAGVQLLQGADALHLKTLDHFVQLHGQYSCS